MGKVVTIYLSDEETRDLKDFCDENQCTQYSALCARALSRNSFEQVGKRFYLRKEEEIEFIKAMNKTLNKRTNYQRYGKPVKARIKTIIKEEPIKLAQYIRNKHQKYQPHIIK